MTDKPFLTDFQATKAYHRPGWASYAAQAEADRRKKEEKKAVILKEKHMHAGSTRYTVSVIQRKNGEKPYVRISGYCEPTGYRGTIVVFAPYVPAFLGILQELSKEMGI